MFGKCKERHLGEIWGQLRYDKHLGKWLSADWTVDWFPKSMERPIKKNSEFAQPHSCKNSPHSLIRASGSALNVHCNFVTILLLGLIYIWALRKKFTTRCYVVFSHTTSTIKQLLIYCHCYSLSKCQFTANNELFTSIETINKYTQTVPLVQEY